MQLPPVNKRSVAVLSAIAIAIHSIENLIPTPLPWLRIGLSNTIILIAFLNYGFRIALSITLIKVFVSGLLIGTFPGPGFILSLSGGLTSTVALWMASFMPFFGITGLSVISAISHISGQLFIAYWLFIKRPEALIAIAPLLLLMSTLTGAINGSIAGFIMEKIEYSLRENNSKTPEVY